jgi:hypothetical protein
MWIFQLRGDRRLGDLRGDRRLGDLRGGRRLGDLRGDRRLGDLRGDRRLGDLRGDRRLGDLRGDRRLGDFLLLKLRFTELWTPTLSHKLFKPVNTITVSTNPVQLPGKVVLAQASVFDHQSIDMFNKVWRVIFLDMYVGIILLHIFVAKLSPNSYLPNSFWRGGYVSSDKYPTLPPPTEWLKS